jgi:hypothetical protein
LTELTHRSEPLGSASVASNAPTIRCHQSPNPSDATSDLRARRLREQSVTDGVVHERVHGRVLIDGVYRLRTEREPTACIVSVLNANSTVGTPACRSFFASPPPVAL